jgi:hypothetical protein
MGIAYISDYLPHYLGDFNIAIGSNLTHNNYQAIGYRRLTGYPAIWILT